MSKLHHKIELTRTSIEARIYVEDYEDGLTEYLLEPLFGAIKSIKHRLDEQEQDKDKMMAENTPQSGDIKSIKDKREYNTLIKVK